MIRVSSSEMSGPPPTAEVCLWRAVIARAIEEWQSGPLRRRREAEQYLFEDQIDFPTVCESAGMNVAMLRSKLLKIRRETCAGVIAPIIPVAA